MTKQSKSLPKPAPPNWGDDKLTEFFDLAKENCWATFVHLPQDFNKLIYIDRIFDKATSAINNTAHAYEAFFLFRSQAAFRGAARLATSGQLVESYALMRSTLENALYAFHIFNDPTQGKVWLNRDKDDQSRKSCRKNFQIQSILTTYENHDPKNSAVAKKLYDDTIGFGAHPNQFGVVSNLEFIGTGTSSAVFNIQLNTKSPHLEAALKDSARVGVCALFVFETIFNSQFQQMAVSPMILQAKNGL
jgi:hypothetical protein